MRNSILLYMILLISSGISCQTGRPIEKQPPCYDLSNPVKYFMPEKLLEVSGITFRNNDRDSMYAVQDESGIVFISKTGEKRYREVRFAKDGDYEDITEMDDYFFILRSDGRLYGFQAGGLLNPGELATHEWRELLPKGEYEGLYASRRKKELYAMCKDCAADKKTDSLTIYVLDWEGDTTLNLSREIKLSIVEIKSKLEGKMKRKEFQPSALAQHPITNEWFILSSVNKILVIADENWNIKSAWGLKPSRFRQPEGMAFDKNGNLFISNEGDELTSGNVLEFAYNPQ